MFQCRFVCLFVRSFVQSFSFSFPPMFARLSAHNVGRSMRRPFSEWTKYAEKRVLIGGYGANAALVVDPRTRETYSCTTPPSPIEDSRGMYARIHQHPEIRAMHAPLRERWTTLSHEDSTQVLLRHLAFDVMSRRALDLSYELLSVSSVALFNVIYWATRSPYAAIENELVWIGLLLGVSMFNFHREHSMYEFDQWCPSSVDADLDTDDRPELNPGEQTTRVDVVLKRPRRHLVAVCSNQRGILLATLDGKTHSWRRVAAHLQLPMFAELSPTSSHRARVEGPIRDYDCTVERLIEAMQTERRRLENGYAAHHQCYLLFFSGWGALVSLPFASSIAAMQAVGILVHTFDLRGWPLRFFSVGKHLYL